MLNYQMKQAESFLLFNADSEVRYTEMYFTIDGEGYLTTNQAYVLNQAENRFLLMDKFSLLYEGELKLVER